MQESRRELVDLLLGFVGEAGDSEARTVANGLVNLAIESIWHRHPWRQFVSPAPWQVTLVGLQRSYALPEDYGRIPPRRHVRNVTKGVELEPLDAGAIETRYSEAGTTLEVAAQPAHYAIAGTVGVALQPAAAGEALELVSDDGGDLDVFVTLEGRNAAGRLVRTRLQMTGLAAVAAGTWTEITAFSKAYNDPTTPATALTSSRGTVTLRTVVGATVLQTLLAYESAVAHPVFTVYPKPDSGSNGHVIAIPWMRRPVKLIYDSDQVPVGWGPAVFEEMVARWRENVGDVSSAAALPRPELVNLIEFENSNLDGVPKRNQPYKA